MKPIEGRLQTGEHILAKIIQNGFEGARVRIARFFEDYGEVEFLYHWNLSQMNLDELNKRVNRIIDQNLEITTDIFSKDKIEGFDLSYLPEDVKEIRVVSIGDFDSRPCKDPHVSNTSEIGKFVVNSVKRVGDGLYKFKFRVE